jgi:hypothetical protein
MYKIDSQLVQAGNLRDVCMSPHKGQTVKAALQYNSKLRNMNDKQFMKHLGWFDDQATTRPPQHHFAQK